MRISDLIAIGETNMRDTVRGERIRFGQSLSNALYAEAPETYDALMGDENVDFLDPFYTDDNLTRFIGWLIDQGWEY